MSRLFLPHRASASGAAAENFGCLDPDDTCPERLAELHAWLRLQAALGLRPVRAIELLRRHGQPAAALRASHPRDRLTESELDAAVAALRRCRARALPVLSPLYPPRLRRLVDAAPLLLVQGDVGLLSESCVAVVGARAPTAYGLRVAAELAGKLAEAGLVIVSGLARGIDAAAHRGALEAGGATVAVQACGLDRVYPREHRSLAQRIQETGALLSELPPGTPPRAPFFPFRNRLIAGLSRVVIVVEARERSGSLITARHGLEQGTEVMAVPGPIDAPTSVGPNRLIRDGARPVLGVSDVLEALGWRPPPQPPRDAGPSQPAPPEARAIWTELRAAPATRDELARRLGWPAQRVSAALLDLELGGHAALDRDGRWRAHTSS